MPFVYVNFAFGDLIGVGSSVPISIAHGKGERDKANNILGFGVGAAALSFCLAMVFAVAVCMWPFFRGRMDLSFVRPRFSLALILEVAHDGAPVASVVAALLSIGVLVFFRRTLHERLA